MAQMEWVSLQDLLRRQMTHQPRGRFWRRATDGEGSDKSFGLSPTNFFDSLCRS